MALNRRIPEQNKNSFTACEFNPVHFSELSGLASALDEWMDTSDHTSAQSKRFGGNYCISSHYNRVGGIGLRGAIEIH